MNFVEEITSPANASIKLARALEMKKTRRETGLFLAEGARHVQEGLDHAWHLETLIFAPSAESRDYVGDLIRRAGAAGARLLRAPDRILEQIGRRDNAQNVVGLFRQRMAPLASLNPQDADIWIALERPKDPGNLGTIIRTADSVGAGGVILIEESCDPFSSEAVRASMGSVFAVPIARASFDEMNTWRQSGGAKLVGTALFGSTSHHQTSYGSPCVLLMGNEQSGISRAMGQACDALVRLPMAGKADSLNLAIATAVTVYEIWRQNGFRGARS